MGRAMDQEEALCQSRMLCGSAVAEVMKTARRLSLSSNEYSDSYMNQLCALSQHEYRRADVVRQDRPGYVHPAEPAAQHFPTFSCTNKCDMYIF